MNDSGEPSPEMIREAERIARGIYNGTITDGEIDPEMTGLVAEKLRDAVMEGFGKEMDQVDYNTVDYNRLASMEKNVFQFSGAKNYQMLESMRNELYMPDGTIRPWNDFKNRATGIVGVYNGNHLRTEYNTAVASSQMAAKWIEFEKNKAFVPYLQYRTAKDRRVRPTHAAIDDVIRHIDDAFWDTYYPPNGWNCRCDVIAVPGAQETPLDKIALPDDVPPMFQTNFAKTGMVFPEGHPYYVGVPPAILRQAEAMRKNVYSLAYTDPDTKATVHVSNKADMNDKEDNMRLARLLTANGESVKIRPHVENAGRNPELELNGVQIGDFKTDRKKTLFEKFVRNSIDSANKQEANIPVLVIETDRFDQKVLWQALRGELLDSRRKKHVTEVWILLDENLTKLTRESIVNNRNPFK